MKKEFKQMETKLLSVRELARDVLNISESEVYLLAETGRLPAYKIGRVWRFQKEEILQWLKDKTNQGSNNGQTSK